MMRVGIGVDQLSRRASGGIGTYVSGLIKGLEEVSECQVVEFGRTAGRLAEIIQTRLWKYSDLGVARQLDVIHATTLAGPFGRRGDSRRTLCLQDLLWRDQPQSFTEGGRRFHESRYQQVIGREDITIMVTTPAMVERLKDDGVSAERVARITLGIETGGPRQDSEDVRALLKRFGVVGNFVLAIGTVEPRKNYERLIIAHHNALVDDPSIGPLVIVGAPGWGSVDLAGAIHLTGLSAEYVNTLRDIATLHAYVPLAEGWGLPPLEALAVGGRVVASQTVPSVMGRADVVLVDPLDSDAITEGILSAAQLGTGSDALAVRMASVADLTWVNMAREHLEVWR
jgi:glycosyltransferase involved in cell wall biosynthesis